MSGKHATLERGTETATQEPTAEPEGSMPDPDNLPIDSSALTGPITLPRL